MQAVIILCKLRSKKLKKNDRKQGPVERFVLHSQKSLSMTTGQLGIHILASIFVKFVRIFYDAGKLIMAVRDIDCGTAIDRTYNKAGLVTVIGDQLRSLTERCPSVEAIQGMLLGISAKNKVERKTHAQAIGLYSSYRHLFQRSIRFATLMPYGHCSCRVGVS